MSSSLVIPDAVALRPRRKGGKARAAAASGYEHIFVIAGPSGSGKSTFMREFVEGRLPRAVADELPPGAGAWERTSGNELSRKGLAAVRRAKGRSVGLVVHYDIMRAYTRGFEHYANDPAIQAVVEDEGSALTVLTILPSREALFEQFLTRARNDEYEEWWDKRSKVRLLKRKLRAALYRLIGKRPRFLKEGHLVLLGVYGSDERFRHWTSRWSKFLEDLRERRDNVRLVYVAPAPSDDGRPRFERLFV